ncbi:MAG: homoserine dehydrogenase [Anaerolineae bacterium]|nr:homoserine dehydrogenase [Anaerolineae bacterium]
MRRGKRVFVVQYGLGQVGRALLRQVLAGRERLRQRTGLEIAYLALADSRGELVDERGLADETLRQALEAKERGTGLTRQPGGTPRDGELPFLSWSMGPLVVVDVTAADGMETVALEALEHGCGVVLANKRPLAGSVGVFRRLTASPRLRFEATVGAGLPWIEALTHLLDTGDQVLRLEAAVSGTLGYILGQVEAGVRFSAAVREACARGYAEPDPRQDLSAADVRRKALILARMLGQELEWDGLPAEPLYPVPWNSLDLDGFLAELPALDRPYAERMAAALAVGHTLRYVAEIGEGHAECGLREVTNDSSLGRLRGSTCLLAIWSERYAPEPLLISGPGAGAEVTAAGVYADIISLGMEL